MEGKNQNKQNKQNKNIEVEKKEKKFISIQKFTKKITDRRYLLFLIIKLVTIINMIFSINSQNYQIYNNNRKLILLNEIIIKIKGFGTQKILSDDYENTPPSSILINGNITTNIGNEIINLELEENIITMKWDNKLDNCLNMFSGLTNLIEVDFSNFDSTEVTTMSFIFEGCSNLISVNFGYFNSTKLENMGGMFFECESLEYIDLSNIDTSSLNFMGSMFYGCYSLISIKFGKFDTSKVEDMNGLFADCISLVSLDLSSFNVSSVKGMNSMFNGCTSLISLNLTGLDVSSVTNMNYFFFNCTSLISLDLSGFRTTSVVSMLSLFSGCTNLEYIDISNFDVTKTSTISFLFYECNNLKYVNFNNFIESSDSLNVMGMFDGVPNNFTYCISNKENIPLIMSEIKNKTCTINDCSINWNLKTKKIISEKNICVYNCSEDEKYIFEYKNKCYDNCPNGTLLSENQCLISCLENEPFEKNEECFTECSAQEFFNKECIINNKTINAKEKMINIISNDIIDGSMDSSLINVINENKDLIIEDHDENYIITSSYNQNSNKNEVDKIIIDFINCENILKENSIINNEQTVIILEMDYSLDDFLVPIIEYEIFHPETKQKIDLSICIETEINISIPVIIEENNLYINNPYSEYYKNKDYPNILDNNDENILIERKEYFNENYLSLCEKNCKYKEYNTNTKKVLCECKVKTNFTKLSEIKDNKDHLLFHIESDLETDLITDSDTIMETNSVSQSETISEGDLIKDSDIISETNSEKYSEIISEMDLIPDSDTVMEINSNIDLEYFSETDLITAVINKKCLFKKKITEECEELITFEDLINKNYIPLDSKDSIDKMFEIISSELKHINKTIEDIIEGENVKYQMTTTEKQKNSFKNNDYPNISLIDFEKCEKKLQEHYHIDMPLIIIKVDIKRNDTISTQVEYQVFNPYSLEQLNLSWCDNETINIYPPINLDKTIIDLYKNLKEQGYDLFDSNDNFYNDICSLYSSFNNTDVILKDRKNDFYKPNISLCEDNCEYVDFNVETLKANCQCNIKKQVISDTHKVKFSPNKIIENFYKVEKYANVRVVICYDQVFNKERLKKNLGSYISILISLFFIISMSINFITLDNKIRQIIQKLIFESNSIIKELEKKEKEKNEIKENLKKMRNKKNKIINTSNLTDKNISSNKILQLKNNKNKIEDKKKKDKKSKKDNKKKKKEKISNPRKKNFNNNIFKNSEEDFFQKKLEKKNLNGKNKNQIKIYSYNTNININSINSNKNIFMKNNEIKIKSNFKSNLNLTYIEKIIYLIPKKGRIKYFSDDELNSLNYENALKIDTRNYFQFYLSLLKQTHLIIFTFFIKDYNLFLLKLSLFLISFELFFFMNALFFNDDSLHKIYENEGKYDFIYQIPKMIYSTVASQVISSLLEKLSLSQDLMLELKEKGDIKQIKKEINKVIKCIKIKCFLFLIIGIILLFGFWYYLSAFCAVYYNTQIPLIKDNFISFLTSMIYPFLFDLFPGIFRILGIYSKIKCLFIISKIITIIIGVL